MAATTYELIVKTVDQTSGPMSRITGGLGKGKIAFAAVAASATAMGAAMLNAAKQMETIQNQLRLVTKNSSDLAATQTRLTKLARDNRSTLGPTVELYTKLKVATADLGFTNERVEGLVTKLTQALVVAGADAGTTAGVIRQFGQAMASGTVRGDEFNSIVEGMGPALAIMAQESGITVGQLREMSQAGELTAETFAELLEGSNALTEAFNKMETPLGTLEEQLSEAFTTYLSNLSKASGATAAYRKILEGMLGIFDKQNEAFLEANTPIGKLEIELKEAQEALAILKAEALGMNRSAMDTRDSFGHWMGATDGLSDSIREITPPVDTLTKAVEEQQAKVIEITNAIGEMKKEELAATIAKQQAAAAAALAAAKEKERLAAIEAELQVIKDQKAQVESLANAYHTTLPAAQAVAYQQSQNQKIIDELNNTLETNTQLTDEQKTAYEQAIAVLKHRNKLLGDSLKKEEDSTKSGYTKFLEDIIKRSREAATQLEFKTKALAEFDRLLQENKISIDVYAQGVQLLGKAFGDAKDEAEKFAPQIETFDQFFNRAAAAASKFARTQTYEAMVMAEAKKRLDEKRISLDQYAQLAARFGNKPLEDEEVDKTASEQMIETLKKKREAYDNLLKSQDKIAEGAAAAGVTQEVFRRELEKNIESMNIFKTEAQLMQEELEKNIERVSQSISQQLATAIVEGRNMSDVFKNIFKQMLANILQQILQSQISNALSSLFPGGGGMGGGSPVMSILGMALGFMAEGGVAKQNRPYIVGEKGPELFMPGTTGRVVPNEQTSMGGAPTVNFNISAVDTQSGTEFILKNKKQIEGVIQNAYERRGRRGIA